MMMKEVQIVLIVTRRWIRITCRNEMVCVCVCVCVCVSHTWRHSEVYFRWLGRSGFGGILTSRDLPWDVGYRVCELDSYQVVIWSDSEELSEVAECHWGV